MTTFAVFEFREVMASGDMLEPPHVSKKDNVAGPDADYYTNPATVAVQIIPSANIRITTDGTQVTPLDRFIAANQLATVVFHVAAQWRLKVIDA